MINYGVVQKSCHSYFEGSSMQEEIKEVFFIIDEENSHFEMARIIIPKHYFLLTEQEGGQQNIWLKVMTYGPRTVSMTKSKIYSWVI